MDDGLLEIYSLADVSEPGNMPDNQLVLLSNSFFGDRTVGYNRQYAAKSVNEQVDRLARIWRDDSVHIGMIAVIEGEQYRIDNVQHLYDDDGLKVTDLTLAKLEGYYDVGGE